MSENLLDHVVVALIPVNFRLHHQHGDVLVESLVVFGKRSVDSFGVTGDTGILNCFGLFAQSVDMVRGELLKFAVGLFMGCLVQDEVLEEFEVALRETLVS